MYVGHDLYITAETDDEAAARLGFFSIAGKPLDSERRSDGLKNVTKFRCIPQNDRCVVIERKASSPFRALHRTRMHQLELFKQAFTVLSRGLQEIARA